MRKLIVFALMVMVSIFLISCGSETKEALDKSEIAEVVEETVEETAVEDVTEEETQTFVPTAVNLGYFLHEIEPDSVNTDHRFVTYETYYFPANYRQLVYDYTSELADGDYRLNYVTTTNGEEDGKKWSITFFKYDDGSGLENIHKTEECHLAVEITTTEDNPYMKVNLYYHNDIEFIEDGYTMCSYARIGEEDPYLKEIREDREEREAKAAAEAKVKAEAAAKAEAKAEAETKAVEESVNKNASPIPEFSAFLNIAPSEEKDRYYGGTRKYYQKIPLETQDSVVSEVLNLLNKDRYQLELIEKVEGNNRIEYNYRYTGNVGMEMIHSKNDDSRYYHLQFTVYNKNNDDGVYGIHFHYCPEFDEENVGYTVSERIVKNPGSGGGGIVDFEGGDIPEFSKLECLSCHGTKDCSSCSGKGYKVIDDIRSDCTRCNRGTCPTCNGTGTR